MAKTKILPILVGKFYEISKRVLPRYAYPRGSHRYTFAQLAACLSLKIYYHLTYREIEDILSQAMELRKTMELAQVPDHSTLFRAQKMLGPYLARIDNELKEELQLKEDLIAHDGTGLREEQASVYYQTRRERKYRQWRKLVLAVGTQPQFILAAAVGKGPGSDAPYFKSLKQQSRRWSDPQGTLHVADKGFDGKAVAAGDIVPPIRRGGRLKRERRIIQEELYLQARLDGVSGQRWKSETVNSVIKRVFGEDIRSRKEEKKDIEVLLIATVYNFYHYAVTIIFVKERGERWIVLIY